jgi:hypothetical protein
MDNLRYPYTGKQELHYHGGILIHKSAAFVFYNPSVPDNDY